MNTEEKQPLTIDYLKRMDAYFRAPEFDSFISLIPV